MTTPTPLTTRARCALAAALAVLGFVLLACSGMAGSNTIVSSGPRWACPSPTPRPYGEEGPVKDVIRHTRPITEGGDWEEKVYYEEWEQEYGSLGGPPFPSPTPYGMLGTSYALGQRVEVWPFHLRVTVAAGPLMPAGARQHQLQSVRLEWYNHTDQAITVSYLNQLRIQGVKHDGSTVSTAEGWGITAESMRAAGMNDLPNEVPPGASSVTLPILTTPGDAQTVAVTFRSSGQEQRRPATPLPGTPTAIPPTPTLIGATPTPNAELRDASDPGVTVLWTNTVPRLGNTPLCDDAGALTDWDSGDAWGEAVPVEVAAPPGASRVVQLALAQVGKHYVWGATGPETFDCSGLMVWSYSKIGIRVPRTSAEQHQGLRRISGGEAQPGDFVFFDMVALGHTTHVGMLVGDLNGDGRWDMVHAASPELGVRLVYDVFGSAYYSQRLRGVGTVR